MRTLNKIGPCRCRSDDLRHATAQAVMDQITAICDRRGVNCSVSIKHEAPAAACHPDMIAALVDACRASEQVKHHASLSSLMSGVDSMALSFLCAGIEYILRVLHNQLRLGMRR